MSSYVGIDLGAGYSRIAVATEHEVKILRGLTEDRLLSSIVSFKTDEILVGKPALSNSHENIIFDACRVNPFLNNPSQIYKWYTIHQEQGTINGRIYKIPALLENSKAGKMSQKDVITTILKHLLIVAKQNIPNLSTSKAVISVPDFAGQDHRKLITKAAKAANIEEPVLINHSTAIAYAYLASKIWTSKDSKNILILNCGASSTSVSIFKSLENGMDLDSMSGKVDLGGEDFTNKLIAKYVNKIQKEYDKDCNNPKGIKFIREACERAKKELSLCLDTEVKIEIFDDEYKFKIDRKEFEDDCSSILDEIKYLIKEVITHHSIKFNEILLVGGTSRIPRIKYILEQVLEENFPKKTNFQQFYNTEIVPEEAVLTGAAIRAAKFNKMSNFSNFNIEDRSTMEINCCLNEFDSRIINQFKINQFKAIPYMESCRVDNKGRFQVQIFEGLQQKNLLHERIYKRPIIMTIGMDCNGIVEWNIEGDEYDVISDIVKKCRTELKTAKKHILENRFSAEQQGCFSHCFSKIKKFLGFYAIEIAIKNIILNTLTPPQLPV